MDESSRRRCRFTRYGNGRNEEVRGGDQGGEVMMMRKRTSVTWDSAIGVEVPAATRDDFRCRAGSFEKAVKRGNQVKADVPDKHQHEQKRTHPMQERDGPIYGLQLRFGPNRHVTSCLPNRLSQLDAEDRRELPGIGNRERHICVVSGNRTGRRGKQFLGRRNEINISFRPQDDRENTLSDIG